jgi:hypothetical protein
MQLPINKLKQEAATTKAVAAACCYNNHWLISAVLSDTNVTNANYLSLHRITWVRLQQKYTIYISSISTNYTYYLL